MRPQVGKGAREYVPPKTIIKTKARIFIESRIRHNISVGEDYLVMKDIETAINMNALEQRMKAKKEMLRLIEKEMPKERLIKLIEDEIDLDRHRLVKYLKFIGE